MLCQLNPLVNGGSIIQRVSSWYSNDIKCKKITCNNHLYVNYVLYLFVPFVWAHSSPDHLTILFISTILMLEAKVTGSEHMCLPSYMVSCDTLSLVLPIANCKTIGWVCKQGFLWQLLSVVPFYCKAFSCSRNQ